MQFQQDDILMYGVFAIVLIFTAFAAWGNRAQSRFIHLLRQRYPDVPSQVDMFRNPIINGIKFTYKCNILQSVSHDDEELERARREANKRFVITLIVPLVAFLGLIVIYQVLASRKFIL